MCTRAVARADGNVMQIKSIVSTPTFARRAEHFMSDCSISDHPSAFSLQLAFGA